MNEVDIVDIFRMPIWLEKTIEGEKELMKFW